ncbi:MAG: glycosyltransferase [Thaumarchaeota archaeon]|nr:glycosyltransferase [Nitrososphaerota archaeon]
MISVVLPAFNEGSVVENVLRQVTCVLEGIVGYRYEVILVDDGSVDDTRERALAWCRLSNRNCRVIGYSPNMGKGYALGYGSRFASGDFIVFMDCDLEISPSNLQGCIAHLKDADILIASKRHPNSHISQPSSRKVLSLGFNTLVRVLTGVNISDTQSGLKVFRRESLASILPLITVKRYAFDVEVLTVSSLLGLRMVELPIMLASNASFGTRHTLRMFIDLLGIFYRLRLRRWYQNNVYNKNARYIPILKW